MSDKFAIRMTTRETPAEYRQRVRGYDPWIDPPELGPPATSERRDVARDCDVCQARPWRYGCPRCGRVADLATVLHARVSR